MRKRKMGSWYRPGNRDLYLTNRHAQRRQAKQDLREALLQVTPRWTTSRKITGA
jgi:hypothetical protein